ncbi:MAG: class A beta-lactamase-related serine hydrolase [Paludibacter sp.]|nr:class A beta-lactamase-related serine hydrolase [Paludibacter sp.]
MNRNRFLVALILSCAFTVSQCQEFKKYDFSPLDQLIGSWIQKSYYPGASVCIVRNNQVVFQQSYGTYTPDTKVYVASAGKWVAAATIAAVVDKTKLGWDDTVEQWLPEFGGNPQGKIKLRQLLSHTSGIKDYLPVPEIDTFAVLKKSVARILKLDTTFRAGSRFQYGGLAMQVAGRMAEVAYGKDFETVFEQEIARPLGMINSHFVPINLDGGHAPMLAGGFQTTLNDYMQFLNMIYHNGTFKGKRILKNETVAEMQADQVHDARVLAGEYIEKAFGDFHKGIYGFGEWREKVDSNKVAYQISSPGWAGAYPWINKRDSVYGFFITHVQGSAARSDGFSPFYDAAVISKLTSTIIQSQGVKQGFANIGGAMLFYEEKGQGEPLILLHAHSVDRRMWDKQFNELAKHYRVIRYDLRGYGLSSMPVEGQDFTACEDLKKFMAVMRIDKAYLVGLSLGAMVISDFMTVHPECVKSAVLADGALTFDLQPRDPEKDLKIFKSNWKMSMLKGSCIDSPFLMSLIDDWRMWQVAHRESSKVFLGTAARNFYQNNKLKIPVLFIVGECDFDGTKKAINELASFIPVSKVVTIKGAGHFSCIEQPPEFTNAITTFLK